MNKLEEIKFDESDIQNIFKTKSARQNLKKAIRKIYDTSLHMENNNNFKEKLSNTKSELIEKYLNTPQFYIPDFDFDMNSSGKLNIKFKYIENTITINKAKLHNRIREIKENTNMTTKKHTILKNNKLELKHLKHDTRVDNNMINMYYQAKKTIKSGEILNPMQILDDMKTATNKYYKYLENAISQSNPKTQYMLLKNNYTDYMSLMTNTPIKIPDEILNKLDKSEIANN